MPFNARLFSKSKLRTIVEITDEISDHCQEIADAMADYESAEEEETWQEKADRREEAREAAFGAMGDLLNETKKLQAEYDKLFETMS